MSYTDKCCGVCDEYSELYDTGKREWWKYTKNFTKIYKRFESSNVCKSCIDKKALIGIHYNQLKLHITMDDYRRILSRGVWEAREGGYCTYSKVYRCYVEYPTNKVRLSKPKPDYYCVTGEGIQHQGLFHAGGIDNNDKRKLRRTLRKLGVIGDVTDFIV